jgi:hypothetical protein
MIKIVVYSLVAIFCFTFFSCETPRERKTENIITTSEEGIAHNVHFYTYTETPDYPDAILEMYSPLGNQNFKTTKVPFEFNIKNYPFGEKGQGFQLKMVLNGNDPVGYNMPIFQKELNEGTYRAVAYLVNGEGLALKEFGNYVDRDFRVMDSQAFPDTDEPFLVVNMPHNDQEFEEGEVVIVDFLVLDGSLKDDGYKVSIKINQYEHETQEMEPVRIEKLPAGEYDLSIQILDQQGNQLDGIFTSSRKKIKIS